MIAYDPRDWFRPVIDLHRSDSFRKALVPMAIMGAFTAALVYTEIYWLKLTAEHQMKNVTVMHTLLGFAISMLLVFRTNTAYDRWWEGRKLWGSLVNTSRNLAVKLNAMVPPDDQEARSLFAKLIGMFARELGAHLMKENTRLELDERPHPELPPIDRDKHVPAQVAALMQMRAQQMLRKGAITGEQMLAIQTDLSAFLDICGACERIKNTPIPYSYSSFIKKFIVLYSITLPLGFAFTLGWLAVPVVMFIFYVLASLELIAEEIEDPFGKDRNDLPMVRLADMIQRNANELLL